MLKGSWGRLVGPIAISIFLCGCGDPPSALDPKGPAAARLAELTWIISALGAVIFLGVMALLAYALLRRGDGNPGDQPGLNVNYALIVGGGIILPLVVLPALFFLTLRDMAALAAPEDPPHVTIEVVGYQFWWEVRYPDLGIITANEIHIPTGERVELRLTSVDVIHSFWVPELHGKTDLVPGRENFKWIQADAPGVYRGLCAEYCGIQHAHMQFLVVAQPPEEFQAWVEQQSQPAAEPVDPVAQRGEQIFMESACAACHAIAGTPAQGRVGPDLTHLASRMTIAARMLENTRENLSDWITDPQGIKPGNNMPPMVFPQDDLEALLTYLQSLE